MLKFTKYQAAGNAYTIVHENGHSLSSEKAISICHPVYGVGGDGVICWQSSEEEKDEEEKKQYQAVIFNPDGSVAEKSGNGLRILATYLFNSVCPDINKISILTSGTKVVAFKSNDSTILLEMGQVVASSDQRPLALSWEFNTGQGLETALGNINGFPVSIGNPHFVMFSENITVEDTNTWGPHIENHPFFANRTNVQFAKIVDSKNISAEIWERGAGYTLSSGSSSCAIVAVAHQLGLCGRKVTVSMPGGKLVVEIREDNVALLTGPVSKTVEGVFNSI